MLLFLKGRGDRKAQGEFPEGGWSPLKVVDGLVRWWAG